MSNIKVINLMSNLVVGLLLVIALAGTALCLNTPNIQTVSIKSALGHEDVSGYLALPSGKGPHPGIIAFHENWGIRDWMKQQIEALAEQGYVVLAIDLYHGKLPKDEAEGEKMGHSLSKARAYHDSEAAFNYLARRGDVDPKRIGAIGWAMGGRYAIQLAVHEPRLAACVDNYGQFPIDPSEIGKVHAQVLLMYGEADPEISAYRVRALEGAMKAADKSLEIQVYKNAPHEFLDPDLPRRDADGSSLYRPEAAKDASERIMAFFAKNLKPSRTN